MKAVLYLLTAVATGFQAWFAVTNGEWRPPAKWLEYLALAGAGLLFAAAMLEDRKLRSSWPVAVAGLILLWLWYVPALIVTFHEVAKDVPVAMHLAKYRILALIPTALLVATTVGARKWRPTKNAR